MPGSAGYGGHRTGLPQHGFAGHDHGIAPEEVLRRTRDDALYKERIAYRQTPNPHFLTYGPKTRREFLRLKRLSGGQPG